MHALNKASLIGHVGKDPKKEVLKDGTAVVRFSLATTDSWKDKSTGDWKDQTEWHSIVIWNDKLIDVVDRQIRKGCKLYLEGQIKSRKWTDKDKVEKTITEVVLPKFGGVLLILTKPQEKDPQGQGDPSEPYDAYPEMNDQIPF